MPMEALDRAEDMARKSDLSIVLGTSMQVEPAASLAIAGKYHQNFKLVLVNLQKTEKDSECDLRIFSTTDKVCELLMKELELEIPKYVDLNLGNDSGWLSTFNDKYYFRSPSQDWYSGPEDPTILQPYTTKEFLNSITSSPPERCLARVVKASKATEEKELTLKKGALVEVLRINQLPEGRSWCFVVIICTSQNDQIRMGYTLESNLVYL